MKKILSLILSLLICLTFFACNYNTGKSSPEDRQTSGAEPNTTEAPDEEPVDTPAVTKGLILSEVITSNKKAFKSSDGKFPDVVELVNNSDETIKLSDYFVSDKKKNLKKWQLPVKNLNPGEVFVFYCSDEQGELNSGFSLSSDGENFYISTEDGTVTFSIYIPKLKTDVSFGLSVDEKYVVYTTPTIGKINEGKYYDGISSDVVPDIITGIASDGPINVALSSKDNGKIYYTTDGSVPNKDSYVYDGKISIGKTTVVRAYNTCENKLDSEVFSFTYFVSEPKLDHDIISLSVNRSEFDNMSKNYWDTIEIPCNASYFGKDGQEFSVNCGIEINGQTSQAFDKKSFKLSFKSKYGPSKLKYKMFENLDVSEFDELVLRSGSGAQASYAAYINDEFCTSIVTDSSIINEVYSQVYKPVNVYINGEYWGLYFVRDKVNEDFCAQKLGVSSGSVTVIAEMNNIEYGKSQDEWNSLWNYIKNHSLKDNSAYEYIKAHVSIESVTDYYILQAWASNYDSSNVRVFKSSEGDGKWRFIFFDLDYCFSYKQNTPNYLLNKCNYGTSDGLNSCNALFYKLFENEDYREYFFERLDILVKNDLNPQKLTARWDALMADIHNDMVHNINRWKGHECEPGAERTHNSMEEFESVANAVRSRYFTKAYLDNMVSCFEQKAVEFGNR